MKIRVICVILLALVLCGCGENAAPAAITVPVTTAPAVIDLQTVYTGMAAALPEMVTMDEMMALNLCGIRKEDCAQMIVTKCADGLRADEIWLIEAKDAAALKELQGLAQSRLDRKGEESITYSPEQYAVVQAAQVITAGNYLAVIVTPEAAALAEQFNTALKG